MAGNVKIALLAVLVGAATGLAIVFGWGLYLMVGLAGLAVVYFTHSRPDLAVGVLLLALPLAGTRTVVYFPGLPDITVGRIAIAWAIVVIVWAAGDQRRESVDGVPLGLRQELARDPLFVWVGVFLALMLVAGLRGPSLQAGIQSWLDSYLLPFSLLLVVIRYRWSSREIDRVVIAYLLCCCLWSILALIEARLGRSFFAADGLLEWASPGSTLARTGGPFVNPAFLGTALGMGLVLGSIWAGRHGAMRRFAVASIVISMLGLAVSQTRASWLGAVVGVFVVLATLRRKRMQMLVAAALGLAMGLFMMISLIGVSQLEDRTTSTSEIFNRVVVQRAAVDIVLDHPLLGVGSERFASMSRTLLRNVGSVSGTFGVGTFVPHNSVLSAAVDGGVVAGVSLVVVFGVLFRTAVRLLGSPSRISYGRSSLGCLTVFAVNAMFIDIFLGATLVAVCLATIGVLLSSRELEGKRE